MPTAKNALAAWERSQYEDQLDTPRGRKRFTSISNFIAQEFYPDYADAWEEDVAATVEPLSRNPRLGVEAFPDLDRPELRRLLLANKSYWVYYRISKTAIDILSIKHRLQRVPSHRSL